MMILDPWNVLSDGFHHFTSFNSISSHILDPPDRLLYWGLLPVGVEPVDPVQGGHHVLALHGPHHGLHEAVHGELVPVQEDGEPELHRPEEVWPLVVGEGDPDQGGLVVDGLREAANTTVGHKHTEVGVGQQVLATLIRSGGQK